MLVTCAFCGATVPADNVNLDRMLAKCGRCNAVFGIGPQLAGAGAGASAAMGGVSPGDARSRRLVAMPTAIRVLVDGVEQTPATYRDAGTSFPNIVIERRWFGRGLFFALFFCLFWDSSLVLWYAKLLRGGPGAIGLAFFPLLHVAAGVFLTYSTICGFFNRTRIAVQNGILSIRHGPFPWPGNQTISVAELHQLFCEEIVGRRGGREYRLCALLKTGRKAPLLRGLAEADQALFIEQALESRLGIVDVPVAGEYV
jgi:hypothetical protein